MQEPQHDDGNPYAPPTDVDDKVEAVYDLHGLARYYNKTTTWWGWFVRILLIEIVLLLAVFFITFLFSDDISGINIISIIHTVLLAMAGPVNLITIILLFCLFYFSFRLFLQLKLKNGFIAVVVFTILTTGYCLLILLLFMFRPKARKILETHGVAKPKNGLYDLTSITEKSSY